MDGMLLVIGNGDNVGVALKDIESGSLMEYLEGHVIEAVTDIPYSHKVALASLEPGDAVIKYGEEIGRASAPVRVGEWVHTHNMEPAGGDE